jgi:hypothetical protein
MPSRKTNSSVSSHARSNRSQNQQPLTPHLQARGAFTFLVNDHGWVALPNLYIREGCARAKHDFGTLFYFVTDLLTTASSSGFMLSHKHEGMPRQSNVELSQPKISSPICHDPVPDPWFGLASDAYSKITSLNIPIVQVYIPGGPGFGARQPQDYPFTDIILEKGYQVCTLGRHSIPVLTPSLSFVSDL